MPCPVVHPDVASGGGRRLEQLPPAHAPRASRPHGVASKGTCAHLPGRHGSHLGTPRVSRDGVPVIQVPIGRRRIREHVVHKSPSRIYHPHMRPAPSASVPLLRTEPVSKQSRWAPHITAFASAKRLYLLLPTCFTHLSPRPPSPTIIPSAFRGQRRSFPPSSISPWPSMGFFEVCFRDSGWHAFSKSLSGHTRTLNLPQPIFTTGKIVPPPRVVAE